MPKGYMVWWRKSLWIRFEDGPHLRTAWDRRRLWRAQPPELPKEQNERKGEQDRTERARKPPSTESCTSQKPNSNNSNSRNTRSSNSSFCRVVNEIVLQPLHPATAVQEEPAGAVYSTTGEAWRTAGEDAIHDRLGLEHCWRGCNILHDRRGLDHCWRGCNILHHRRGSLEHCGRGSNDFHQLYRHLRHDGVKYQFEAGPPCAAQVAPAAAPPTAVLAATPGEVCSVPMGLRATRTPHPLRPWCLSSGSLERRAAAHCGVLQRPGPCGWTAVHGATMNAASALFFAARLHWLWVAGQTRPLFATTHQKVVTNLSEPCGAGCCGGCCGCGTDCVYDENVCPLTPTVKHLIMGAVSLWTRLPALYLCTGPPKSLLHIPAVGTALFFAARLHWLWVAGQTRPFFATTHQKVVTNLSEPCGAGCCGGCCGCGTDGVYDENVCPLTPTVKHQIMGAVSLWTRLPALYLCTGPPKSLLHIPAVGTDNWISSLHEHSDVHHRTGTAPAAPPDSASGPNHHCRCTQRASRQPGRELRAELHGILQCLDHVGSQRAQQTRTAPVEYPQSVHRQHCTSQSLRKLE